MNNDPERRWYLVFFPSLFVYSSVSWVDTAPVSIDFDFVASWNNT